MKVSRGIQRPHPRLQGTYNVWGQKRPTLIHIQRKLRLQGQV